MNSFGRVFRVQIFGESHGESVGILIDGCPPGIRVVEEDFLKDLMRRKSGDIGTTTRMESDKPTIKSGIFNEFTSGAPILIEFKNDNTRPTDYDEIKIKPRPGHADFTSFNKYMGFNDYRGGGHFSGRLTVGLVAAGVIAKKLLHPVTISAELIEAGGSNNIDEAVKNAIKIGDSIGGIIECRVTNVPISQGEPFFDSVESQISHIIFSVPAVKGIEFGAGFASARMFGSEHNDELISISGKTRSNHSGGINGGLSNGNDIVFRVAVKPASSIAKIQNTINITSGKPEKLKITGRHDSCIALRAPVVIESVTAIALADFKLLDKSFRY
ncbi:MAG: chorismate synthase [Candidatus Kapaibacterium sp.]